MKDLKSALKERFGEDNVNDFQYSEEDFIRLLKIDIQTNVPLHIIMTNGMSDYQMPVPERYKNRAFNEIFFCLPSYWDMKDKENPAMNWPFSVIQKLARNVLDNETWYGVGHTITNGNPPAAISPSMKQEYFMLSDPILLENQFSPLLINDKTIHFLAIIPLFYREFERKSHHGYYKWIGKFKNRDGNEIIDDFRESIYKSRWNLKF